MGKRGSSLFLGLFALMTCSVFALDDVQFLVVRKKLDESEKQEGVTTKVTKEIAYKVTVLSKTSKELTDVSVTYNIYYESGELGSKSKPELQIKTGNHIVGTLKSTYPVEFETDPIKLETATLHGGYVFTSGGAGYTKDKVLGVWFKAFNSEGKLLGQYVNPSTISKKMEWKDLPPASAPATPAAE